MWYTLIVAGRALARLILALGRTSGLRSQPCGRDLPWRLLAVGASFGSLRLLFAAPDRGYDVVALQCHTWQPSPNSVQVRNRARSPNCPIRTHGPTRLAPIRARTVHSDTDTVAARPPCGAPRATSHSTANRWYQINGKTQTARAGGNHCCDRRSRSTDHRSIARVYTGVERGSDVLHDLKSASVNRRTTQ